jgi:hypothetical protein
VAHAVKAHTLESAENTLNTKLSELEKLQGELDIAASTLGYVPEYMLSDYEDMVSALCAFADTWGFMHDIDIMHDIGA